MITPQFSIDQDELQIIITIHAPYTNVKDTEINVDDDDVRFYSAPYYLRLSLPGKVEETDNSCAKYISDDSKFVIRLDKQTPGEVFPNLDMITSFLQPKSSKKRTTPLIEVLDDGSSSAPHQESLEEEEWFVEQNMEEEMPCTSLLNQNKYGFANNHCGLSSKYEVELAEVADIKNPDSMSPSERRQMKHQLEQEKFSDDHYLSDLLIENDIPRLIEFTFDVSSLKTLTDKNKKQLKNFANRDFLLDKTWQKRVHLGLIDILFAYCYDWRATEGTQCVESPWNISRLSGTLCWFETFDTVQEVLVSCMRRSLCYPLNRNWELSIKVFKDVIKVLKLGQTGILVCLLDIHTMFSQKDPYYLLNQLYIEDYCVWIQKVNLSNLESITTAFKKALKEFKKDQVGLDLCELEIAAKLVEDEEMEEEMAANVEKIMIG